MDQDRSKNSKYLLSSVNNALKILEILMVRDNISLKELTAITGFDKTSAFKMLYTLQHRGFIEKTGNAKYHLSSRLSSYAETAATRQSITDAAKPFIFQLWASTQQTVTLSVLNSSGRVVIVGIKLEKDRGSIAGRVGAEMDAHTNASGKVLLANLPPDVQSRMVHSIKLKPRTPKTITAPHQLMKLLEEIRGESVVFSTEENWVGHSDMAAPIFDRTGSCIATLGIVFQTAQLDMGRLPFYKQQLQNAAYQLSTQMGYLGYLPSVGPDLESAIR